ncbi:hypothetical protein F3Y22_tig00116959pilonHSYRG00011 [Hibiscus syriacus]|uniref:Uncharacterized protein n=1 Tax=Hibiscus syriacus TaxID=106335 RepID=A0A6A2WXE8_HIBSY|nr:hypothetical protein F3Y22_tig00116959pilonHSYRG00011 [Hibiscus syriacus]
MSKNRETKNQKLNAGSLSGGNVEDALAFALKFALCQGMASWLDNDAVYCLPSSLVVGTLGNWWLAELITIDCELR